MTTNSIRTTTHNGTTYAAGGDPGGSMRAAWRVAAYRKADGKCAVCGVATRLDGKPTDSDRAEGGHILPGVGRGGYVVGNIINMCRDCNVAAGDRDLRADLVLFVNPDAVVTEVPRKPEVTSNIKSSLDVRRALGLGW